MFKSSLKKKSSINIIPMIDVIFFLLVFFMLFTSFRSNPSGIDLQLPKAVTVTEQENNNFVIDIDKSGKLFFEGDQININEIKGLASKKFKQNKQIVAIINADKEAKYKYIVNVMDNLRQVGIYKLALAAEKK